MALTFHFSVLSGGLQISTLPPFHTKYLLPLDFINTDKNVLRDIWPNSLFRAKRLLAAK
jgi:hypothetical protein